MLAAWSSKLSQLVAVVLRTTAITTNYFVGHFRTGHEGEITGRSLVCDRNADGNGKVGPAGLNFELFSADDLLNRIRTMNQQLPERLHQLWNHAGNEFKP